MTDFFVGIGFVLVIEGLLWAAFPHMAMRFLQIASETPEQQLRTSGIIALALGVLIIWFVRG